MAEFKLGRIRFVWKNDWVTDTVYYKDDVIAYGGKIYICVIGHTSAADFFTDLDVVPSKWNLISDGQTWKGNWKTNTRYVYSDVVRYGPRLYICNEIHTSANTTGSQTFTVTVEANEQSPGNNVFVLDGDQYPSIQFTQGYTYTFNQDDASNNTHPLVFSQTKNGTHAGGSIYTTNVTYLLDGVAVADASAYDSGFAGATTRRVQITIDEATPDPLYYFCYNHSNMAIDAEIDVTSEGLETDVEKWDLYADGLDWKGTWIAGFAYKRNDMVKYGGITYVCIEDHTAAATDSLGLEDDIEKWNVINSGIDYKLTWASSTRYKLNDIVTYGAGVFICVTAHTSTSDFGNDASNWTEFVEGLQFESDWTPTGEYQPGDIVRYGGFQYIADLESVGVRPAPSSGKVTGVTQANPGVVTSVQHGLNSGKSVAFTDIEGMTNLNDNTYYAKVLDADTFELYEDSGLLTGLNTTTFGAYTTGGVWNNTNIAEWTLFSEGISFQGEWGDDSTGFEYQVGDLVSHGGYTYICITDHTEQEPPNTLYWKQLNTGVRWRGSWIDDAEYYLGDIVRYGDNSYICIQQHISEGDDYSTETDVQPGGGAQNSRPDQDATGTYWNIIAVGTEQSVLTTTGDLVYYGGAGPTRLPIGTNGQILQVSPDGIPEWATLNSVDDVYYVAETGVDSPAPEYGKSFDRPFKTIRYAAQQVERGARNRNAAKLLELNRRFIQREILEWTEQQIADGTSPFDVSFTYDTVKCERDMGFIVDALVWDITHGGNVRTREAALSYLNDGSSLYTLNQEDETVASINYGLTVIGNVLAQTAPDVNYQITRGDNSTRIVDQWFDSSITAESGVLAEITALVTLLTDAIADGEPNNVPARLIRTNLIRVATGYYKETLPIIVPAETCIMGDELRAVNVQPRTVYNDNTLTPASDFVYTNKALERVEAIIGDIVEGSVVTPTSGNTETQYTDWPIAEAPHVAPEVTRSFRSVREYIDIALGNKLSASLIKKYDLSDVNVGNARDLILLNKKFIQEEVTAYITDNYPNLKYSRTKCKQDVGFILDALAYDLTYGGNWQMQTAGLAYFAGYSGALQIDSTERAATVASYEFMKALAQTVGRDITVTPVLQSKETQRGGEGGSVAVSNTIGTLFDGFIDIVENGTAQANITYPTLTDVDEDLISQSQKLVAETDTIGEKVIDFVNKNFGSFNYNSSACRRDLTNIITDTAYDVALGTNYNAVYNGIAYTRPTNSYNLTTQKVETIGAIRKARDLLKESVTTDGSSQSGSSNASTRITTAFNEIVDILQNGTVATADPGDGVVNALSLPSPTGVDQNRVDAKDNLVANRDFIAADVVAYVNNNTPPAGYSETKCSRDVKYIVDALCYDILYGGTMATTRMTESYFGLFGAIYPDGQVTETVNAYTHMASIIETIVQEGSVTAQSGNLELQTTLGTPATATEATELTNKITIITDALTAGNTDSVPAVVYPSITWADAEYQTAHSDILSDRSNVIKATIQYISDTYNDFTYDHAKCTRDIGYIIDAARYDWMLGTNYASIVAGLSYLRLPSAKVVGNQKTATIAANEYALALAKEIVDDNRAQAGLDATWQIVQDYIWHGSSEGSIRQTADAEVYNAVRQLELNKEFIVQEAMAYVDDYFQTVSTGTVDATDIINVEDTTWLSIGQEVSFENLADSTSGLDFTNLVEGTTYYVRDILSATQFTVSDTLGGAQKDIGTTDEAFAVIMGYTYSKTACARDLREYIDAVKWDLQWGQEWKREYTNNVTIYRPASYKATLAARYYVNAVIGSQEEDFFYMRNGTGLRLMTFDGLRGDLTAENANGTSRVTAGAYSSLDPGWGPDDTRAWITARSPYMQNCTCLGYGAIGQKIDGALHNGGNDSMVSNDFTQLISDGIGAWITNNGRAELVSVFTYYSYIGYLAENGGRIRGTNGNNSYGVYGSVAEGVDPDETPVTAVVDNETQYNATIGNVFTDTDQILALEFSHAGNDYTEAVIDIFGAGDGEQLVADEFRDNAVNQVRIVETVADSAGGSGYLVAGNTAQTGSSTSITLAATDGQLSTAYPGMKILITGGAGVGNYGLINTYNSGSKVATVIKESDGTAGWDHVVPGTTITSPNSSSTYFIEPAVSFTDPTRSATDHTITSGNWDVLGYFETSEQFTAVSGLASADGLNATFNVTRNGEKYYVSVNDGGTGFVRLETVTIDGADIGGVSTTNDLVITVTTINSSTGAIVDFDFEGIAEKGSFVAIPSTGTSAQGSVDGQTWSSVTLGSSATWTGFASGLADDGSSTYKESFAVVAGNNASSVRTNYSTDGSTWTSVDIAGIAVTSTAKVAFGNVGANDNRFVVIGDNDTDIAYSQNGGQTYTTVATALPSTGYTGLAYGKGLFVAVKSGSQEMAYTSDGGETWTTVAAGMPSTAAWSDVVWGNGRFIAIAAGTTSGAYSIDGSTWVAVTLPITANKIAYGQGMFAISGVSTTSVGYSQYGLDWDTLTITAVTTSTDAIAFGNPARTGKFIALGGSATATEVRDCRIGAKAMGRVGVANQQVFEIRMTEPGSGYTSAPTITITDPNNIDDVETAVRLNDGTLANPTFINRGSSFLTASAEIDDQNSNGYADFFQNGQFVAVRRLSARPVNGSNIEFDSLPGQYFKLVNTVSFVGSNDGSFTGFLQISPDMTITDAPANGDPVEMRIRYSQVRLTGHDFLDIGTGNFTDTNYPGVPVNDPVQANETRDSEGGRVFFTATDQDGNFRVGDLFSIEQATGVATLNAEAFNIAGLQELTLGEVTLGGNSASISEFSTDPFFTANSDSVVPTQRAVKAYIEAQIGGGGASLNVNSVTAGDIFINTNQITTVSGEQINIKANVVFTGNVLGLPEAFNYFLR